MGSERIALLVAIVFLLVFATGRELPNEKAQNLKARLEIGMRQFPVEGAHKLEAQLDNETGSWGPCWDALYELRSCSNEIILFFLNGETYLGPDCCRAIEVITRNCWPAMLVSVGLTAQEGDILRGYCNASGPPGQTRAAPPSLGPVAV